MTTPLPKLPSTVGKRGKSVMPPDGRIVAYEVIDEVRSFQDPSKEKVLILQLMRLATGKKEVRVGYYIIGKLPKMKGKWVWGQFAAFMPLSVFSKLVRLATRRGWFGTGATRSLGTELAAQAARSLTRTPPGRKRRDEA